MTPEQIAGTTEHSHQVAFFCALNQLKVQYPCLEFAFAVPNGGERNKIVAARLKTEGVRKGVPDVILPYPRIRQGTVEYHGMFIEFKRPKTQGKSEGRLSPDQLRYLDYLVAHGYFHFVAYDYLTAVEAVLNYLN